MQANYLEQKLIPTYFPNTDKIPLHRFSGHQIKDILKLMQGSRPEVLGVSLQLSEGKIHFVAFASTNRVLLLNLQNTTLRDRAQLEALFANNGCPLAAFGMARIGVLVYHNLGCRSIGVDLGALFALSSREPMSPSKFAYEKISPMANRDAINAAWYGYGETNLCLRAWLSASCAERYSADVEQAAKVDTRPLNLSALTCLGRLVTNIEILEQQKPTQMQSEFDEVNIVDGQVILRNSRYKTRIRRSEQTTIVFDTVHGKTTYGQATGVQGKNTTIHITRGKLGSRLGVENVRVVGREELTNAERARDEFLLHLLRGEISLDHIEYIRILWFTSTQDIPRSVVNSPLGMYLFAHLNLNNSQKRVAAAMVSEEERIVIAHGPPGTGKTKTISAAVKCWEGMRDHPVWVIAQSNVAVKNIALSFAKHEIDFKILVSKEFYVEWHEHIYESIDAHVLRSDELFHEGVDIFRAIGYTSVILSTLSMLSNPGLDRYGMFDLIPMERLVVDEASQIDTFEFMHLFHKFTELRTVCLFGDPKQLPPYGKDAAPDIKTIFDFKHLRPSAYFLDTQYRMPLPMGEFISRHVYDSKLHSVHKTESMTCVKFVDVVKGEETNEGRSWINQEESHAVINIVQQYYRSKSYCIITPYDAQRGLLQRQLKAADLPWDNVYNVDSFQGHEAPYIIISTVRTNGPGFLRSQNRVNVMLTRFQTGLVVVTNRQFLITSGKDTLLGTMAQHWEERQGRVATWTSPQRISERTADLPGVPSKSTSSTTLSSLETVEAASMRLLTARLRRLTIDAEVRVPAARPASTPKIDPAHYPSLPTAHSTKRREALTKAPVLNNMPGRQRSYSAAAAVHRGSKAETKSKWSAALDGRFSVREDPFSSVSNPQIPGLANGMSGIVTRQPKGSDQGYFMRPSGQWAHRL